MSSVDSTSVISSASSSMASSSAQSSVTWPPQHKRTTSAAHNVAMRAIIKPWGGLSYTPPGCQAVSYSSWTRFSASGTGSKSSEDLKASVLWAAQGTTPDYDPPLLERTYLGVDQPLVCGKPNRDRDEERRFHRRNQASTSSWSTASSEYGSQAASEPIIFRKEAVKGSTTSSLLTSSFKSTPPPVRIPEQPKVTMEMAKEHGLDELSTSQLPSATDSDDEEEDDGQAQLQAMQARRRKKYGMAWGA
ncbi:hypothetical protein BU26DRAFT_597243 [Trematosphaeria pertusa]|uniref:Uncharacterized protein n=1 Tax=Trematosphaeria pertusa TaxID=390896 RepID=A0A6A6IAT8_9PLEO|nr:uncharacterized protein BU26DRAFT_597243 [Trematosphaeria pertusa]KAF2247359.1 hypothetical protein BU26DRAFT_597243 [Trematosphaeria pertusa]